MLEAALSLLFFIWCYGAWMAATPVTGVAGFVRQDRDQEMRAWVLTAAAAAVLSCEGIFVALPALLREPMSSLVPFMLGDSYRARVACDFFVVYCASDLAVGLAEYPSQLRFLEGYVHHAFYIALLVSLRLAGAPNAFWVWSWCEVPTLVLACNKLFVANMSEPSRTAARGWMRRLFAATFISFRVLLFSAVILAFFALAPLGTLAWTAPPALAVWGVNVWWAHQLSIAPAASATQEAERASDAGCE